MDRTKKPITYWFKGIWLFTTRKPGSAVVTDAWATHPPITNEQYRVAVNQSESKDHKEQIYGIHLITSFVRRLIWGTFQGRFDPKHLQNTLDRYVFRFNRRKSKYTGK